MIKFYSNRELSRIFKINLAKWKRWSREFLPPDPLGGLQSGYARQYNMDEAFTVFIGGHLVADLKFTIPESRQILNDLNQWLLDHGFYFDFSGKANSRNRTTPQAQSFQIEILCGKISNSADWRLGYRVKAIVASESIMMGGIPVRQNRYFESTIGVNQPEADFSANSWRTINISKLRKSFLNCFKLE